MTRFDAYMNTKVRPQIRVYATDDRRVLLVHVQVYIRTTIEYTQLTTGKVKCVLLVHIQVYIRTMLAYIHPLMRVHTTTHMHMHKDTDGERVRHHTSRVWSR